MACRLVYLEGGELLAAPLTDSPWEPLCGGEQQAVEQAKAKMMAYLEGKQSSNVGVWRNWSVPVSCTLKRQHQP